MLYYTDTYKILINIIYDNNYIRSYALLICQVIFVMERHFRLATVLKEHCIPLPPTQPPPPPPVIKIHLTLPKYVLFAAHMKQGYHRLIYWGEQHLVYFLLSITYSV